MPTIREVMNWDEMPPAELEEKRRGFLLLVKERQEKKAKGEVLPEDIKNQEPPLTDTQTPQLARNNPPVEEKELWPREGSEEAQGHPHHFRHLF